MRAGTTVGGGLCCASSGWVWPTPQPQRATTRDRPYMSLAAGTGWTRFVSYSRCPTAPLGPRSGSGMTNEGRDDWLCCASGGWVWPTPQPQRATTRDRPYMSLAAGTGWTRFVSYSRCPTAPLGPRSGSGMTNEGRDDGGGWVMLRVWWMGVAHAPTPAGDHKGSPLHVVSGRDRVNSVCVVFALSHPCPWVPDRGRG